jgi:hypothetical protein
MKLFSLIIFFSLIALSLEICEYYKSIPRELDSFDSDDFTDYSFSTHFELDGKTKITSNEPEEADKNVMNYSSCKEKKGSYNRCVMECLSFESKNVLTHYHYHLTNSCIDGEMLSYFGIDNKCQFIKHNNEVYYQLEVGKVQLFYSFRTGTFKSNVLDVNKLSDIEIKLQKDQQAYTVSLKDINENEPLIFTKQQNYFCFNALTEITKDYNEKISNAECHNSFDFISKVNSNWNHAMNYFHSSKIHGNNNFLDNLSLDYKAITLTQINKRFVYLKADYESIGSIWYSFKFGSNQCYHYFLTLVESLTCSKIGHDYMFILKKGDDLLQYRVNLERHEVTEFDVYHKKTNKLKLLGINVTRGKLTMDVLKSNNEVEDLKLFVPISQNVCNNNLKLIEEEYSLKSIFHLLNGGEETFGLIEHIIHDTITYSFPLKQQQKKLNIIDFKVVKYDRVYTYTLYGEEETLVIFLKHDIIKKLSIYLCQKNTFYFKSNGDNEYGKITFDVQKYSINVEKFKEETSIQMSDTDFTFDGFSSTLYFKEDKMGYKIYTDSLCSNRLTSLAIKMSYCQSGYRYSAIEIEYLKQDQLTDKYQNYVEPEKLNEKGKILDDLFVDLSHKHNYNFDYKKDFTILNMPESSHNYLVQLISKTINKDNNFTLVKVWFLFEGAINSSSCKKYFSDFLDKSTCHSSDNKINYFSSNDENLPGTVEFKEKGSVMIDQAGVTSSYSFDPINLKFEKDGLFTKLVLSLVVEGGRQPAVFRTIFSSICKNLDKLIEIKYAGLHNFNNKIDKEVIYYSILNDQGLMRAITGTQHKEKYYSIFYSYARAIKVMNDDFNDGIETITFEENINQNDFTFYSCREPHSFYIKGNGCNENCFLKITKTVLMEKYHFNLNYLVDGKMTNLSGKIDTITFDQVNEIDLQVVGSEKIHLVLNIEENYICQNYLKQVIRWISQSKHRLRHRKFIR